MKVHKEPVIIVIAILISIATGVYLLSQPKDTSPTVDGIPPISIKVLD